MQTDATSVLPGFRVRGFSYGETPLRYAVGGSGPPVVLVHGLGGAASNWIAIAPALAADHRVIVPELPGHGGSAPLPAAPTVDAFADAILAVLEAEDALPAPWVGHSLGGLVGLRAAARRPEAVTGIVLAAAAGISSSSRAAEVVLSLVGLAQPGRLVARHRAGWAGSPLGRTVAFGWWGLADPAALDPQVAEAFLSGPAEHTDTLAAGRALIATDPRLGLDRVRCPCLCLWGGQDNWVPLADGMEYSRRLGAPLRVIADCGHLLIAERPEACLRAIREFLASL